MTLRNPYDFVRFEPSRMQRAPAPGHDVMSGLWGSLEGAITAETPVFIGHSEAGGGRAARTAMSPARTSLVDTKKRPIIPGATLKGLFRSVVEAVAPGCVRIGTSFYRVPREFLGCDPGPPGRPADASKVCPACALFGLVAPGGLRAGRVSVDDAVAIANSSEGQPGDAGPPGYPDHPVVWLPVLSSPKPQHEAWYTGPDGGAAGRKFYYHQPSIRTVTEAVVANTLQNQRVKPLGAGTVFELRVSFRGLTADELDLLLFALVLEPDMRHKVGTGKPAGLGSIRVDLAACDVGDPVAELVRGSQARRLEGPVLGEWIRERRANFATAHSSGALDDLRRIWRWPPYDVTYAYPSREWFTKNPKARLSEYR
jgi:CRISPR/Cas system CSM-associated protein Csm3 (group 7 of RAMP superfamily)